MTKKCLICKIEASPNSIRSFHMFPKNELLRKKWMDAINLSTTPNFKTTYICSDHFDDKFFHYSDELRSRKRLRPEAVPENINLNQSYLLTENVAKEAVTDRVLVSSINKPENNILKEKNLELNKDCDKETKICGEKMPVNCFDKGSLNEQICSHKLNNSSVSNDSNSKKRKNVFTQNKAVKRVRFMNGFKTEYIFREDFVSDEAWNRFLRFTTYKKSKMAAAHNKNSRKGKKIKNLKVLIKEKKKEKKHSL